MATTVQAGQDFNSEPEIPAASQITRLFLVGILTACLAYPWGYSLITWMFTGQPNRQMFLVFLGSLVGVMFLSAGLGRSPALKRYVWPIGLGSAAIFSIANAVIIYLRVASTPPLAILIPLYLIGNLWVVWLALFFFWPLGLSTRTVVLAALVGVQLAFSSLFKVEGLTGDAQVDLVWRQRAPEPVSLPAPPNPTDSEARPIELGAPRPNDFAQYLGPHRDGRLTGPKLARDWNAHPPVLLWRQPIGAGWGGFAVVGDFAFTQEQRPAGESVVCYEANTGRQRWIHADPVYFESSLGGPGPRATPTIDGPFVFAMGSTGLLLCLKAATGEVEWKVQTLANPDSDNIAHGMCGSPLVHGGRVIVSPCGPDNKSLAAYDAKTGDPIWREGTDRGGYSSPMRVQLAGTPLWLNFNASALAGHDFETGKVLWSFPWQNDTHTNCSQPIVAAGAPDQIFLSTGYGTGSVLLKVAKSDDGQWSVSPVWQTKRLESKFCTPVLVGDHVYGLDNGILSCLNLRDGRQLWKKGRYGHGQVLLVDDLLLVQTEKGPVVLVEPSPEKLIELGTIPALSDKTWNTMALAGPVLLVRNAREAAAYRLPLATP